VKVDNRTCIIGNSNAILRL